MPYSSPTSRLTLAPRFASSKAIPATIPRDAPVTMMTLLHRENGEGAEDILQVNDGEGGMNVDVRTSAFWRYYSSCLINRKPVRGPGRGPDMSYKPF